MSHGMGCKEREEQVLSYNMAMCTHFLSESFRKRHIIIYIIFCLVIYL